MYDVSRILVAKLHLSLQSAQFTHRSFASVVSLILFALHTTQLNPAKAFRLLRAYRGIYRQVTRGHGWDDPLAYLESNVHQELLDIGSRLVANDWWTIAEERRPTYDDLAYDVICYTDASAAGWGAIVQETEQRSVTTYQQRWINELSSPQLPNIHKVAFNAKHSAHAEPRAVHVLLQQLVKEGLRDGARIAVVTDHFPIVHAQKHLNGFGGIGRGYALNKLYEYTYDLLFNRNIQVFYFYLAGRCNPADEVSRRFGDVNDFRIVVRQADDMGVPSLQGTRSNICDEYSQQRA